MAVVIIGLLAGLIGAGVGIFFALYGLGFFNYMGGKKCRPDAVSAAILEQKILSLNDASKPYHIIKGDTSDLVAEWKIADANWWGILNKNHFNKSYRAYLQIDESRHSVRCFEQLGSVTWSAGMAGMTPMVNYNKSQFSGRILYQKEYAVQYGITDISQPQPGKVYEYKFDVDEIRKPIIAVVNQAGWEWVPVTARRHVMGSNQSSKSPALNQPEQQFRHCIFCGTKLPLDSVFCPKCGKKLER
jgi:hypothetical protein